MQLLCAFAADCRTQPSRHGLLARAMRLSSSRLGGGRLLRALDEGLATHQPGSRKIDEGTFVRRLVRPAAVADLQAEVLSEMPSEEGTRRPPRTWPTTAKPDNDLMTYSNGTASSSSASSLVQIPATISRSTTPSHP